ncbi:MAG: hypothetical protein EBZ48_01625 [Proteobacteria bacterium]|nr:hypothetical protein [Pseudomonadota bacterium]
MYSNPQHSNSQKLGTTRGTDARGVDWHNIFVADPVLKQLFPAAGLAAQQGIGEVTNVGEFHNFLERVFLKKYFQYPYREGGRNCDTTYFKNLRPGAANQDAVEILRDALYTQVHAHWFAKVYMVERYGIERYECETGNPSLAGLLHAREITNPREQLFLVYQLISRNLNQSGAIDMPEGLTVRRLSKAHHKLLLNTIAEFHAAADEEERRLAINSAPPRAEWPADASEEESLAYEFWCTKKQHAPFSSSLLLTIREAEKQSEGVHAKETLFEEWARSHSNTPYTELSSLMKLDGFSPTESPTRIARSCIKHDRCFRELLAFHPSVGTFVDSHGGRDHEILSQWVGYRRLLTHCLLDEGLIIDYPDARHSASPFAEYNRSDLAGNFRIDGVFLLGRFHSREEPLNPREYFHLFVHDCAHFLLYGFYEPLTDFELFRLAWLGSEHYARWFSNYEVLKRVANSPYWKHWPPYTDWDGVPKEAREALFAELGCDDNKLSFYRQHTLYEIIRDAGIQNEIEGRNFLLRLNTNPDFERELELLQSIKTLYGLTTDHRESLSEQLRQNAQDEAFIADVYDEVHGNNSLANLRVPPEVKMRGSSALENFIRHRLRETGKMEIREEELDEYFEPSETTLESFDSFTDRELFLTRFADSSPQQCAQVWRYLSRCSAVMQYLMR